MGGLLFNLALICYCFIVLVLVHHCFLVFSKTKRKVKGRVIQVYKDG